MKPKTFKLIVTTTLTILFISFGVKGYCLFGSGNKKLEIICWAIYGIASIILIILAIFKKKLVKQDSDQQNN